MSEFVIVYARNNNLYQTFAHTVDFILMPSTEDVQKAIAETEGWKPEEVIVHQVIPPSEQEDEGKEPTEFLTQELRDEFAKHALVGLISQPAWHADFETTAVQAYQIADCMLKAR